MSSPTSHPLPPPLPFICSLSMFPPTSCRFRIFHFSPMFRPIPTGSSEHTTLSAASQRHLRLLGENYFGFRPPLQFLHPYFLPFLRFLCGLYLTLPSTSILDLFCSDNMSSHLKEISCPALWRHKYTLFEKKGGVFKRSN